jgi:hypothetical protein
MIHYSEADIDAISQREGFILSLKQKESSSEMNNLVSFLDSLKLNTKYYRLTTNKNNGKYKKLISGDTVFLKDLNAILNKLTDKNVDKLSAKIKSNIEDKSHLKLMIIQTILEKSSVHITFISVYVQLLYNIYSEIDEIIIEKILADMYQSITGKNIDSTQSEYLQFCDQNKKIDLIINHSYLVCECEKIGYIKGKINPFIDELMDSYSTSEEDDRFRSIKCVGTILDSLYPKKKLPKEYRDKLIECKSSEKTMKIKFRIMDILERK